MCKISQLGDYTLLPSLVGTRNTCWWNFKVNGRSLNQHTTLNINSSPALPVSHTNTHVHPQIQWMEPCALNRYKSAAVNGRSTRKVCQSVTHTHFNWMSSCWAERDRCLEAHLRSRQDWTYVWVCVTLCRHLCMKELAYHMSSYNIHSNFSDNVQLMLIFDCFLNVFFLLD